jgi:hypothetical protein
MIEPGLSAKTGEAVIAASQLIANRFNLSANGKA